MKIDYHRYKLIPKKAIQHRMTHQYREGMILRFTFNTGSIGYADCHPWAELGDLSIEDQLKSIHEGRIGETPVSMRSFILGYIDAKAREKGVSLFDGLEVPKSHCLLGSVESIDEMLQACSEGFSHFKIKMGLNLEQETEALKNLAAKLPENAKIRVDFNLKLDAQEFCNFLEDINDLLHKFDFFEDPFFYEMDLWQHIQKMANVSLAADEILSNALEKPGGANVLVIKPAVKDPRRIEKKDNQRGVITSYLDHPLGQVTAAYEAANFDCPNEICGLLSHRIYQTNEFSECLSQKGPNFLVPSGTGFGFDELLAKLEFTEIFKR